MRLTDQFATTTQPTGKPTFYRDSQHIGLALYVSKFGKKSWIFEAKIHGKNVRRTISDIRAMKAQEAKNTAREIYAELRQGVDRFENYKHQVRQEKLAKLEQARLDKTPKLEDNIDYYLKKSSHLKEGTIRFYTELKKQELEPYLGIELGRLTQTMVEEMHNEIAERKSGIRATKAIKFLQTLCKFFDLPFPVMKFKMEKPKPRQARLEPPHGKLLFRHVMAHYSQRRCVLLGFLLMTGTRIGEAMNIRKSDVDIVEQTVILRDTKNGRHHKIYLSDACKELIYPMYAAAHPEGKFLNLSRGLGSVVSEVPGVPFYSAHDLRKLFTITATEVGMSMQIVKSAINHVSGDITLMHYYHATPKHLRQCFDAVSEFYAE